MQLRKFPKYKLCHRSRKLRRSHIIPEFLYLPLYDERHRAVKVTSAKNEKVEFIQKGIREPLLCQECETKISRYERYAAPITKAIALRLQISDIKTVTTISVDYAQFKLFQMSLIWRASISIHPMFASVDLGDNAERLRRLIYEGKPGEPHEFGCMILGLPATRVLHRMIWSPAKDELDGEPCIRLQTGALLWYFFALQTSTRNEWGRAFLDRSGILRLFIAPWSEQQMVQRIRELLKSSGKL